MTRNGTEFGIGLAGSPEWHLAPAPPIGQALYYAGHGPETSAPDVGDSAVLELVGLGAARRRRLAVGGGVRGRDDGRRPAAMTEELDLICAGRSSRFTHAGARLPGDAARRRRPPGRRARDHAEDHDGHPARVGRLGAGRRRRRHRADRVLRRAR